MTHIAQAAGVMASSPVYPPSFDASPSLFAWALFSRLLILTLSSATVVRLVSLTRAEGLSSTHPAFYHRVMIGCFLTAAALGSLSDVMIWLSWGEVGPRTMGNYLMLSRGLDGLTMVPFLMGLFTPFWLWWLRSTGWIGRDDVVLTGPSDARLTWTRVGVPVRLTLLCAVGALLVTGGKYAAWVLDHAHR